MEIRLNANMSAFAATDAHNIIRETAKNVWRMGVGALDMPNSVTTSTDTGTERVLGCVATATKPSSGR